MEKLQKIQVKFSSITLNLEEIADYINELIVKVKSLEDENEKLKKELKELKEKRSE